MTKQSEWESPEKLQWSQYLLDSYVHWIKQELIPREGTPYEQAAYLFNCPFVVLSHKVQDDPIFNYGNRTALDLWEMEWNQLMQTPSRLTAEPVNREERALMLQQAKEHGYISDYSGVRISSTGKRFYVDRAVIWNVVTPDGVTLGQGATFSTWQFL